MIKKSVIFLLISFLIAASPAFVFGDPDKALPTGATPAVPGSATIVPDGDKGLIITLLLNHVTIDYDAYNIGRDAHVNYQWFGNGIADVINNVIGSSASRIDGTITAPNNVNVWLSNPNGITIGTYANINVGSFLATTLNMSKDEFGNFIFSKTGTKDAYIINNGNITANRPGGYVYLLSQAVDNKGVIVANLGIVTLASGEKIKVLSLDNKDLVQVQILKETQEKIFGPDGQINSGVKNSGDIYNDGGRVILTAKVLNTVFDYAINNTGFIRAASLVNNNGVVELIAEGPSPVINTGTIEAGSIKVSVTGSDFINRGSLCAKLLSGTKDIGGDIDIAAKNLISELGKKITADRLITIDVDTIVEVVYAPNGTAVAASEADIVNAGAVINAPTVNVTMRKLGTSSSPVYIKAANLYIKRIEGNIDILESLGIGTSVLMRGPPEGFGSLIYFKDSNLTLDAAHVELMGSAPITFYGNITFYNFICTVPGKEIYFEAGKTYTFLGALKIQGAYAEQIKLLSSEAGKQWYIDIDGAKDLTYIWVSDSYNISSAEIVLGDESTDRGNTVGWDPTRTWDGTTGNWNDPTKWSGGVTPGAGDAVIINAGTVSYNLASATVLSLTIGSGATLNFNRSGGSSLTVTGDVTNNSTIAVVDQPGTNSHTLNIAGNFTNNGTFTASAGTGSNRDSLTVVFNGSSNTQSIGGSSTTVFRNLTIDNANGVTLNSDISITGTRTLNNGAKFKVAITGITANNKVYNGDNVAALNASSAALSAMVTGDKVNIGTGSATATFSDKNVGNGKIVTVSGVTISGQDAGDYSITQPTGLTANITPKALTVTGITAGSRVYDGTNTAAINTASAALSGVISGETVNLDKSAASGTFSDKNVGNFKTVTISGLAINGADSSNYTVTQPTTTANITTRPITVTAVTDTKTYDHTTSSTGIPTITSGTLASGDTVTWGQAFNTDNAGTGRILTPAGTVSDGNGGNNYAVTFVTNNTGVINPKTISVNGITANDKVYNGDIVAVLNTGGASLVGKITGDTVILHTQGASGAFSDKNVGNSKTVTISGLTITGGDASNYTLVQPTTTANITARPITVTAVTDTRIYDGTTSSSGIPTITSGSLAAGDSAVWSQAFNNKNAGTGKILTPSGTVSDGNSGNNYNVTFANNNTGIINTRSITVTADPGQTKVYGNIDPAFTYTNTPLVGADSFTGALGRAPGETVAGGPYAINQGTLSAGTNYTITFVGNNFAITAKTLTVTGITANNKTYDGTTNATLNTTGAGLTGVIGPDVVTLNTALALGAFNTPDIGVGKTVTISGLSLGGADAGNYLLPVPQAATTADITPVLPPSVSDSALLSNVLDQLSNLNPPRYPLPDATTLIRYQPNTFTPQVGPVYFYHPLTSYDMAAFDSMTLNAGAYQFINGYIDLVGHEGLRSMFEPRRGH